MPKGIYERTEKHLQPLRERSGKNNHWWSGDKVEYYGIHHRIKKLLPKQDFCNKCKKKTIKLDLSNKSGKYLLDISDWEWLCRKCHMAKDKRLDRFFKFAHDILSRNIKRDRNGRFI